jgi:hypothetical protein
MPNAILDPTGRAGRATAPPPGLELAPRQANLSGLRVGLLDNTKHNAALLLNEIGKLLMADHHAAAVTVEATKTNFAAPAPADLIERYRQDCDVVITGVGDCGSCSASAVADGIQLEQAGVPTAVICSDAFVVTADAMAQLRGAPGYRYARTAHPVAVLTAEQVLQRAKQLLPDVVAILRGDPGGRPPESAPSARQ